MNNNTNNTDNDFNNKFNNNIMNNNMMNNLNNNNIMNNLNNNMMNNLNNNNMMNNYNNNNMMNNLNNNNNMMNNYNNMMMNNYNNMMMNNYNNMMMNNYNNMMMNNFNNNMMNMNLIKLNNNNNYLTIKFIYNNNEINIQATSEEKVKDLIEKYKAKANIHDPSFIFIFSGKRLNESLNLAESGLYDKAIIYVVYREAIKGGGCAWIQKYIYIKFIKVQNKKLYKNISNNDLNSLLKLCLLKEISSKLNKHKISKLPELIQYIMEILRKGFIEGEGNNVKKNIKDVLQKMEGSNILNFSNYVNETIDSSKLNCILNLLEINELKEMNDIKYRLSKYNKYIELFDKEYEKAQKESIFEFSIVSLIIIEREDFEKFESEREKCPNREEKILYHGTSIEPISCILTGLFKKSIDRCYQHGKGVYFTDCLDYCWFYGGQESNRSNRNKIPKLGEFFTLIACSIYYNRNGYRKVKDSKYTPKKNEINFAYAGADLETIIIPDKRKFVGTEYVIWDLDQICPFMSAKLIRNEYCIIWRDNNFSSRAVYNNEWDERFKKFLEERMKYIKQVAKYNIYPFENSEEALELIKRKKYNKIILISNVGTDLGGKKFITEARKIIGNNVIALFLAYRTAHLEWITNFKNALFSNEPKFYEEYIECFNENYGTREKVRSLIDKMEKFYNVKFNFDDNFLEYPYYKKGGKYSDLTF